MFDLRKAMCMMALLLFTTAAFGQANPQQRLMAKRAAELDAYRMMAERIVGLELSSGTHVRDFITESDEIRTSVEGFIKGMRIVDTRYYGDGTVEVDVEVTIRQVIEKFKKIVDEVYKGGKWHKEEFEQITKRVRYKVILVTGSGAARAESNIPDPAGESLFDDVLDRRPSRQTKLPAIYSNYPPAERLKAKRAAELDAYRKLLERIYGLEISSGTYVRDFVTERDEIRTAVEGRLKGMRIGKTRYSADGVVEVEISVTIQKVIETIKRVRDESYRNGRWEKEDFEEISKRTVRKVISVLGTGALDTGGRPVENPFHDGDPEEIIVIDG